MKFPRRIQIAGKPIKVRYDRKASESAYEATRRIITVGVKNVGLQDKLDAFLHEVFEAIADERKICYERPYMESAPDTADYLYVMTHDELNVIISDLAIIVGRLIK